MQMRRLLWTLIAVGGLAFPQDPAKAQEQKLADYGLRQGSADGRMRPVQKLIEVKYADPDRIARLVQGPGISVRSDSSLHAIVVNGPADAVTEVEAMVKKLDVAPANIELTVYLISGNSRDATDDLPKDLASTAKQLRGVFPYKSYRILQSFVLRDRENGHGTNTSGSLSAGASYNFHYRAVTVSSGTPRVVHIDDVNFLAKTPTGSRDAKGNPEYDAATINTDLDIGEGQKVVVGKSNLHGFSEDALILVITAQVVQ